MWYLELASIKVIYFVYVNTGNMPFNVETIWPFYSVSEPCTKLLHHSAVLSTYSGVIISSFWSHSHCPLSGFYRAYGTILSGARYGLLCASTCRETVPLEHSFPVNLSLNSQTIGCCLCAFPLASFCICVQKKIIDFADMTLGLLNCHMHLNFCLYSTAYVQ